MCVALEVRIRLERLLLLKWDLKFSLSQEWLNILEDAGCSLISVTISSDKTQLALGQITAIGSLY